MYDDFRRLPLKCPQAVGVIQTLGFPGILAAADAMVKAGRVTIVHYDKAERGQFIVAIRGGISEVRPAMEAGIRAAENTFGCELMTHYTIPNPPGKSRSSITH
jgi:microcompartment protein CcmL/EutN